MKKRTARILTGIGIFLVALAVLYAIAVAVSAARLRRAYAEIQKAGRPMQVADIIPPIIPDTENAALLYQSAALLLNAEPAPQKEKDRKDMLGYVSSLCKSFLDDSLDPNGCAELQELLGRDVISQALSIVQQGTRRPACRFERDYTNGLQINPFLVKLRGLSQILGGKACLEARAGRADVAWDLAHTQLRFADALRGEPMFISQLVRSAIIRQSCETIQKVCEASPLDAPRSADLANFLKTLDDPGPLALAADGERLLVGEWFFTMPRDKLREAMRKEVFLDKDRPNLFYWALFQRIAFRPSFLSDHAAYLGTMHDYFRAIERPYSPVDAKEDFRRHSLTNLLMPAMYRIKEVHLETIAQVRITLAGLALLQYKQAHGTFPATLDALDIQGLADPFIDRPLVYRAEGEGFILYSVGKDQKDNGGAPKQERRDSDPRKPRDADYDIFWRFPAQTPQISP